MNKEKIKIAREALSDLSYYEWIELKERVDIEFKRKMTKYEGQLVLGPLDQDTTT